MHYTLRGAIARAHPYQLDKTLTVHGAGAEAESTGTAINAVKKTAEEHIAKIDNPHNVTKTQIGLGNVDNTSDTEKPVSVLQAEAIADAKKEGTEAKEAANNVRNNALLKSGGTMTGDIDMDGNHITGLPTPTEDSDIITKLYMENYINETFLGGEW